MSRMTRVNDALNALNASVFADTSPEDAHLMAWRAENVKLEVVGKMYAIREGREAIGETGIYIGFKW